MFFLSHWLFPSEAQNNPSEEVWAIFDAKELIRNSKTLELFAWLVNLPPQKQGLFCYEPLVSLNKASY